MKTTITTLLIILFSVQISVAQNIKRANHLFEKRAYIDAAELFLNEEPKTQEILEKLGDCFYFNSQMDRAVQWYDLLLKEHGDSIQPGYFFKYAQALKGIKNYDEADKWLKKYSDSKSEASPNTGTLTYFENLNSTIKRPYIVHKISSNSAGSDFGTAFYGGEIVFASARGDGDIYDWNNQPYLNLYQGSIDDTSDIVDVRPFSDEINTKLHEASATFTKDGNTMYFTRNNTVNGKKQRDSEKVTYLKIYKAEKVNGVWTNIVELPFNGDSYSTEHPALSPDEKKLYFSSDMPETLGSFDIFVVDINSNGTYGTPKNLGSTINTEHREQFPFVSDANNLYFASDGHFGLGGLDNFSSKITGDSFSTPVNLSDKINSNLDDFAFVINEEPETGYFSSNRAGGVGDDDIYRFTRVKIYNVTGDVKDKNSAALLAGTAVTLLDENGTTVSKVIVGDDGAFSMEIKKGKNYKLLGTLDQYISVEVEFSTETEGKISKNIPLVLESYSDAEEKIVVDHGKLQIKINPIYFDYDKWNIRPDAALELDSVVEIMKKYPDISIEVGAHTDCFGPDEYNIKLSDKRANSVREYLVDQGIPTENVQSKGYGETQPLNHCVCAEVKCNRADYNLNRRSEFVILN